MKMGAHNTKFHGSRKFLSCVCVFGEQGVVRKKIKIGTRMTRIVIRMDRIFTRIVRIFTRIVTRMVRLVI